jgi:23S rRNA (cytidine1920-2'-O)/16S rRNA (cytidine1409-2'-O)-methyltransferase
MPGPRPGDRVRVDQLAVERGLARSRAEAQALILAGRIHLADAEGRRLTAGQRMDPTAALVLDPGPSWASRGADKLIAGLDAFAVDPRGAVCLDAGASTGGFTDCLLQRGAARVYCVDVGQGQLAWKIASDPRVHVLDRVNIRLAPPDLLPEPADVVVIDVSFISLRLVLPALPPLARPGAPVVALVKPQFEVGRADVGKGGIVRDEVARARALAEVRAAAAALGYDVGADTVSPITGGKGNIEFLLALRTPLTRT